MSIIYYISINKVKDGENFIFLSKEEQKTKNGSDLKLSIFFLSIELTLVIRIKNVSKQPSESNLTEGYWYQAVQK